MGEPIDFHEWLTLKDARERSGYSISHLRTLVYGEKITAIRKGRMVFVSTESLDAYVTKMRSLGTEKHNWRREND